MRKWLKLRENGWKCVVCGNLGSGYSRNIIFFVKISYIFSSLPKKYVPSQTNKQSFIDIFEAILRV